MAASSGRSCLLVLVFAMAACRGGAPPRAARATAVDAAAAPLRDVPSTAAPVAPRPRPVMLRALDGSAVRFAQPSRDGRRVAVGTARGVTLLDGRDGTPLRAYATPGLGDGPPRWIDDATLEIFVQTEERPVAVTLDLATGRIGPVIPRVSRGDGGASECDSPPPEGAPRRYRAWGDWNGQVRVTDCDTGERFSLGERVENAAVTVGVMTGGVGDLAWSGDGHLLAVPFEGVRVWDVARRTSRLVSRSGVAATWRPGARELTVIERLGGDDGDRLVRLAPNGDWRLAVGAFSEGRSRYAWSPDGARLVIAEKSNFWVYNVDADAAAFDRVHISDDLGEPSAVAWSDEGTLAVAMSTSGVYVCRGGRLAWSLVRPHKTFYSATLSPDGRWLAYDLSGEGTLHVIWDLTRGRLAFAGALNIPQDGGADWYFPDPDGWTADGALRLRWSDGTAVAFHPESRTFTDLAPDDAGRRSSPDPREGVWSRDGAEYAECAGEEVTVAPRRRPGRAGPVAWRAPLGGDACSSVAWSDDGRLLFAAGQGGLHVIRRRDGARVRLDLLGEGAAAVGVAQAPDGTADTDDAGLSLLRPLDGAAGDPRDRGLLARFVAAR